MARNIQEKINRRGQEHIASLQATVHQLWAKCCEAEGIPADSKFVVFSNDNEFLPFYDKALAQLWQAQAEYAAGGYVGLTIPHKTSI